MSFEERFFSKIEYSDNCLAVTKRLFKDKSNLKHLKNTDFIAHARTDVPMLLEMVELFRRAARIAGQQPVDITDCEIELKKIAEKYK